jgi:hypothetical protein
VDEILITPYKLGWQVSYPALNPKGWVAHEWRKTLEEAGDLALRLKQDLELPIRVEDQPETV